MNIKLYMNDAIACGLIRGDIPAKEINRRGTDIHVDAKMEILESDFYGTQLMIFQRQDSPHVLERMRKAKSLGIRVAYDIDDDLLCVPKCLGKVEEKYADPGVRQRLVEFARESDAIICSMPALAEAYERYAPGVPKFVVPNAIDFELNSDRAYWNRKQDPAAVTILWHGSGSHVGDVPIIKDAILYVMKQHANVKLQLMGYVGKKAFGDALEQFGDRVNEAPWVEFGALPFALAKADIGICALSDIPFNHVRSAIKFCEFGAVGVPVVASPVSCYTDIIRHGVNGYIAERNAPDSWIKCLTKLVEDVDHRTRMGEAARRTVHAQFDIRLVAPRWADVFRTIVRR